MIFEVEHEFSQNDSEYCCVLFAFSTGISTVPLQNYAKHSLTPLYRRQLCSYIFSIISICKNFPVNNLFFFCCGTPMYFGKLAPFQSSWYEWWFLCGSVGKLLFCIQKVLGSIPGFIASLSHHVSVEHKAHALCTNRKKSLEGKQRRCILETVKILPSHEEFTEQLSGY